jgi:hypothetical protein
VDLEDLLEDLLDEAGRAARRGAKRVVRSTAPARRGIRRGVRAVAVVLAVMLLGLGGLLLAVGDPGALRTILGALLVAGGVGSGGVGAVTQLLERRDPEVAREKAAAEGLLTPDMLDDDLAELPRDVRAEFRRLLAARGLVQDLAHDGWVASRAVMEADGEIARLHRLLAAERRATRIGGSPSPLLRQQTADLADLLVALADEAVKEQAEALAETTTTGATLTDAREHLVALREARAEVRATENRAMGNPPTPGTA